MKHLNQVFTKNCQILKILITKNKIIISFFMKSLKFHHNSPCTMICKDFQKYILFLWKSFLYS